MATNAALVQDDEPADLVACTVSRDVQNFDLLIEDMEAECGEGWGDLGFEDAALFMDQPEAAALQYVCIAIDQEDEAEMPVISDLVGLLAKRNIKVFIIAEEVSPVALHQLLKRGAEEFIPYPLPDGALHDAIDRARTKDRMEAENRANARTMKAKGDKNGVILPVHGLAGGTGATTFAVNLAWELANLDTEGEPVRVCLIDLDLQFGSTATYLDLPRRESVFELLQDTESMDNDSFMAALQVYEEKLHVFTSPNDIIPLDIVGPEDIGRILKCAQSNFDYVIVDMPSAVVAWTETVLSESMIYFAMTELDMRSAQNTLRMIRALKGEDLPVEKLRFVLNRAPGFTDLTGKSRVKRMAESLDIKIECLMPDGGKQVTQSNDHGVPLSEVAAKNPLRKEIEKLAMSVAEASLAAAEAD